MPNGHYKKVSFYIEDLYPPNEGLSINILRLQAAYNDISQITMLIDSSILEYQKMSESNILTEVQRVQYRVRLAFLNRIFIGFLAETVMTLKDILDEKNEEFQKITNRMSDHGKEALKILKEVVFNSDNPIMGMLQETRGSLAFHYNFKAFKKGFGDFYNMAKKTESPSSYFVISRESPGFFLLPESLREFRSVRADTTDDVNLAMKKVRSTLDAMKGLVLTYHQFLYDFLITHIETKAGPKVKVTEFT